MLPHLSHPRATAQPNNFNHQLIGINHIHQPSNFLRDLNHGDKNSASLLPVPLPRPQQKIEAAFGGIQQEYTTKVDD